MVACSRNDAANKAKPEPEEAAAQTPSPPDTAGPPPTPPAWAASFMGRTLTAVGPEGACVGNTDKVSHRYAGPPVGAQILGWGWDVAEKRRIERVLLTDANLRVIGAGEGGGRRPDVPRNLPNVPDDHTGWSATTQEPSAVAIAYGLLADGKTVCPLGRAAI